MKVQTLLLYWFGFDFAFVLLLWAASYIRARRTDRQQERWTQHWERQQQEWDESIETLRARNEGQQRAT